MAHYAEINNGIVQRVVVMDNNLSDNDCQEWLTLNASSNQWVKTSYNNNIRKQFAGIGMTYDDVKDKFICQQPFPSWSLNGNDDWQAPTPMPAGEDVYVWNETDLQWEVLA